MKILNRFEMAWAVVAGAACLFFGMILIVFGAPAWITVPFGILITSEAFLVVHLVARLGRSVKNGN